jgi:hypothetical protein
MAHPNKPRLKQGNEIEPPETIRVPPTFRPPGSFEHLVSDGEDWHRLGNRYKVPAAEIIRSNYNTTKPEHVNWYLNHYVDCNKPTPDRFNWKFSTSARDGSSSRAGIVFVKPNWLLVLRDVRNVTRKLVNEWFRGATLTGATVNGSSLNVIGGDLNGDRRAVLRLLPDLKAAGLPDTLAEATAAAIQSAIETYTKLFQVLHPSAFPPFIAWPAGGMAASVMPLPWKMLETDSPGDHATKAFSLAVAIRKRLGSEVSIANQFVQSFTTWFDRAFVVFRETTIATKITGTGMAMGVPGTKGPVIGTAIAGFGFITPGQMPE